MISRYDFGTPWTTGAIAVDVPVSEQQLPVFSVTRKEDGETSFRMKLEPEEAIYGLGETLGTLNKRGRSYRSWNLDDALHTEHKLGLYASHNFLIFVNHARTLGVYFDDPGLVNYDLGNTHIDEAVITSANGDLSVYVIEAASAIDVCREFRELTGPSYCPPKWGFGYIQSRYGYKNEEDIRYIGEEHRKRHIPLDGLSMDIDYMDGYRDFTWDKEKFPDMKKLNEEMSADHLHLVPIMDAGIKAEAGYSVADEGVANGYFTTQENGTPFRGAVWPGLCYFTDFLQPEARTWFGKQYQPLLEAGIEGFWNDMNEPALFYSPASLKRYFDMLAPLHKDEMNNAEWHQSLTGFFTLSNNAEDYRSFYHVMDGKTVRHDRVHNLYGAHMTQASAEGMKQFNPDKRFLLFSRSSYIGAHRYGGVWQGDNDSWWSHIKLNLQMTAGLNMCGFLYTGADIGGFSADTTPELLLRWLQFGVFTPLFRNHSSLNTRNQEIFRFDNWEQMRDVITVRYALIPFLYSEFMKAASENGMMFRPLAFDDPSDADAAHTEDQLMLGEGCMIAPVCEPHANGRHVYLPEDMLMIRFRSSEDYDLIPVQQGHQWIQLAVNEFPLFIRKGCLIPLAKAAEYSEGVDDACITLIGCAEPNQEAAYRYYRDDGITVVDQVVADIRTLRAQADQDGIIRQAIELK